ncbi:hypothetical protein [Allorhodopirellula heiligendammensis]|uniref:Uncharacterized protein n=1 Tax=Allorhodopirellula heiligendammensis TaxID=2714739 RepID=A0A5C6C673_9BACT|nr:hypothetical protein [Allorhodopirellula heiligendammensis]TWU18874.1 hypothetical protein Poly21_10430 [Allorhodopirellula heiligendammensis]
MPPKKAAKKTTSKEVTLKVQLGPDEHKLVKMAAAELEITIAEFLRNAAVTYANQAVRSYYQRELARKPFRPTEE